MDSPFAVINADDFYGVNGFKKAADFLGNGYALIGYIIKNTLSNNGGVTRGICSISDGKLIGINETKNIIKENGNAKANGELIDLGSIVSMNFWCYPFEFIDVLKAKFPVFLNNLKDPLKDEFLLPIIADEMLKEGVSYSVIPTDDQWFGVTYKEGKPAVIESIKKLIRDGVYIEDLYSDLKE